MDAVRLDEHVSCVLAPNPGFATLDGTNTYLVGAPGSGEVVCVDPGPALQAHREAIESGAAARDAVITAVVLTHHHSDHAEAAVWACDWGVALLTGDPRMISVEAGRLEDGAVVDRAGGVLQAVATPGHASDHLCLRVRDSGAVLSGDHVLGTGTTAVLWPDGDMRDYLDSLERLRAIDAPVLYPGHGPVVERPREVVAGYLAHRLEREQQILQTITSRAHTPAEIVRQVYADVDPHLHALAERSVRAHLFKCVTEGRIQEENDRFEVK